MRFVSPPQTVSRVAAVALASVVVLGGSRGTAQETEREPASARRLHAIEVVTDARGLVVHLAGDGLLQPRSIHEAEHWPPRIVVELPGVASRVPAVTPIGVGPVEDVRVAAASLDPLLTHVVFELKGSTTFEIQRSPEGDRVLTFIFPLTPPAGDRSGRARESPVRDMGPVPSDAQETGPRLLLARSVPTSRSTSRPPEWAREVGIRTLFADRVSRTSGLRQGSETLQGRPFVFSFLASFDGGGQTSNLPRALGFRQWRVEGPDAHRRSGRRAAPSGRPESRDPLPVRALQSPGLTLPTVFPATPVRRGVAAERWPPTTGPERLMVSALSIGSRLEPETRFPAVPRIMSSYRMPRDDVRVGQRPRVSRFIRTDQPVVTAPRAQQFAQGTTREYSGDPVSMDFQDADLRAVLRTFAEISGLNIVIDPQVDGTVDVALTDVPWDQALDVILRANQLGYIVDGTVVRIAPLRVLADEEAQRRELAEEQALAGELVVLTRTLSYARADAMAQLLTQSVLSLRGQVQTDERTNTLIVTDLQPRLAAVEDLLDTLDRAEPQVEIEARIVQAGQDFARSIGVQWGLTGRVAPDLGNTTPLTFPNRGGVSGRLGTQGPALGGDPRAAATESVGTAVDLPATAASSALGVTLGSVDGSLNLDVVLSAAEGDGQLRLLSHPRVTTQNNVPAEIVQGDQIPIQTVANNTVTVQFQDAALSLRVTPQITAEDTVIMQIEIDNDFADFARQINGVPPIVTQRASTTVQVANGDTTVIGGIFESERASSNDRVPGLHRIPLLGWLFRSGAERESTDELLIFLTPKIVR